MNSAQVAALVSGHTLGDGGALAQAGSLGDRVVSPRTLGRMQCVVGICRKMR